MAPSLSQHATITSDTRLDFRTETQRCLHFFARHGIARCGAVASKRTVGCPGLMVSGADLECDTEFVSIRYYLDSTYDGVGSWPKWRKPEPKRKFFCEFRALEAGRTYSSRLQTFGSQLPTSCEELCDHALAAS